MAGHLGSERVTVQNLSVVKVDVENNLIAIKGSVPGPKGGIVVIADSVKKAKIPVPPAWSTGSCAVLSAIGTICL